jgi:hypothetical protein
MGGTARESSPSRLREGLGEGMTIVRGLTLPRPLPQAGGELA